MRGIPKTPVVCIGCNRLIGCAADQLCHSCRLQRRSPQNKRFHWTPELDGRLREAYQRARTRAGLSANLNLIQRSCGFTRVVILNRAVVLGLAFCQHRPWTMHEIDVLREHAGKNSVGALAKKLNRTHGSVTAKLKQIQMSRRISDGYTKEDLRVLLGVSAKTIRNWIAWGWMRIVACRIPESSVAKFLRQHPDQYQLSRVEEAWFKGLIFPAFNQVPQIRVPRVSESSVGPFALLADSDSAAFDMVPRTDPN